MPSNVPPNGKDDDLTPKSEAKIANGDQVANAE